MPRICPKCFERFADEVRRCPHHGKGTVEDLAGELIADRYELRTLLGVGGMNSTVWAAWHAATHRTVALKLLPATHPSAAERFARGARLASNLSHPHITTVHDYGRTETGGLFLVMELLEGSSLHAALKREGAMSPERVLRITEQVLRALDHAHRKHIVHRDLKPGNLFLLSEHGEANDFAKVLDFGIAKAFEGDEVDDSNEDALHNLSSEVTHQRQVCGTPHYMAPEQVAMGRVDARTDLYSLGVVMYRMLAARLPFEGKETHELFRMHLTEPPARFRVARPDLEIPPAIEAVVLRALAKDPDERFASANEMRAALREVRRGLGLLSDEDSMSGPPSLPGVPSARTTQSTRLLPTPTPAPPTVELPVPARTRRTVQVLVLSAGMGLAGGGLWWGLRAHPEASQASKGTTELAPEAPRVAEGLLSARPTADVSVEIESTPAGAHVRTALRPLGETPLRVTLPRTTRNLFLDLPGHQPKELTLDLDRVAVDERVRFHATLDANAVSAPAPASRAPSPVARNTSRGPVVGRDSPPATAWRAPESTPAAPSVRAPAAPSVGALAAPESARPMPSADTGELLEVDVTSPQPKRPYAPATAMPVELLE